MPYSSTSRLPASVRNTLPKGAQTIYRKAFENAWEEYKDPDRRRGRASREESAHKVAWSAVKTKYKKNGEGKWSSRGTGNANAADKSKSGTAGSSRKSPTAKPTKSKSASATQKKPGRKSAASATRTKSTAKKKTATGKSGGRSQARWKSTSEQKTGRKTRGRTAAGQSGTRNQQKRKPRKATGSTLQQREALPVLEPAGLSSGTVPQPPELPERTATRQEDARQAS